MAKKRYIISCRVPGCKNKRLANITLCGLHRSRIERCGNLNNDPYQYKIDDISIRRYFRNIISNQHSDSKRRGHKKPAYRFKQLLEWVLQQENFLILYKNWIESGYKRGLRPSIDRINNDIGYTLDNIQIITLSENISLGNKKRRKVI